MGQVWSFTIKHKHLTLSDRNDIQIGIEQKKTFREIVSAIEKDPSTISKEVRKHLFIRESTVKSNCDACPLLKKAPYVCNPCPKKRLDCGFKKQFYHAKRAHQDYEQLLSERRKGIALNKQSFYGMNMVISKAIKKGQHLNHIIASNELSASRSSIYRYVAKGYMSVAPIDFPRMVKFRKRRTRELPPIPKGVKEGRSYQDFQDYRQNQSLTSWLEKFF